MMVVLRLSHRHNNHYDDDGDDDGEEGGDGCDSEGDDGDYDDHHWRREKYYQVPPITLDWGNFQPLQYVCRPAKESF